MTLDSGLAAPYGRPVFGICIGMLLTAMIAGCATRNAASPPYVQGDSANIGTLDSPDGAGGNGALRPLSPLPPIDQASTPPRVGSGVSGRISAGGPNSFRSTGQDLVNHATDVNPTSHTAPLEVVAQRARPMVEAAAGQGVANGKSADYFPIDLPTALELAGANNLQIALAAERVREAVAVLSEARVKWVPSLNVGVGYNKHDGRLQETQGQILEVSRNSLFVGGGPVIADSSLAGGAGGPPRLVIDLSTADVLFAPLVAGQSVRHAATTRSATFNDTLLRVSLAYLTLARYQAEVAIATEAVRNAGRLLRLTEDFARAGTGLQADVERARAEVAARRRVLLIAKERVHTASAELARLLRLDPTMLLYAAEPEPLPICLIDAGIPLPSLVGQALSSRPEMGASGAQVAETAYRTRQELLRPWLPNLYVGFGAGGFGGGAGSFLGNFSDRTDFDAVAAWELRNFGLGNRAAVRRQASRNRQARLDRARIRDLVASEVSSAFHQARLRWQQISVAQAQVRAAEEALDLNFRGIRGGELRAIEAQQAIVGLAFARRDYAAAIVTYNAAQFALLRAIGQPPAAADFGSPPSTR